jgi:hypothetical protein
MKTREEIIEWHSAVIDGKIKPTLAQQKSADALRRMCGWNEPDKIDVSGLTVSQEVTDKFNRLFGMPS